jgi:nicotinamidase-related amidase
MFFWDRDGKILLKGRSFKVFMHPKLLTKECIFVFIDIQEKLFPYVKNNTPCLDNLKKLIKLADITNIPILLTEHYPKGLGSTVPELKKNLTSYHPIEKITFSAFRCNEFVKKIKKYNARTLVICGIESHICIEQTVLDGLELGYDIHVISDGISSRKKTNHEVGLRKMQQCGAIISSTEMAIYEILERADTPEFKKILPVLK